MPFQYVVLRCVPRVDREEFVNVGVVLYCQQAEFLEARCHVDRGRLSALSSDVDVDAVCSALAAIEAVCRGDESAGAAGRAPHGHPLRLREGAAQHRRTAGPGARRHHRPTRPPSSTTCSTAWSAEPDQP